MNAQAPLSAGTPAAAHPFTHVDGSKRTEDKMKHLIRAAAFFCAAVQLSSSPVAATEVSVDVHSVTASGVGDKIGTVEISDKSGGGLEFKVDVTGIPAGEHGFHLHANGDCAPGEKEGKAQAALSAGAHYDPAAAKSHKGPMGQGHKGDLPFLTATDKGVNVVVTAPNLKMADVLGRALVIHEGGDNYTDHPENGGGKGRIACGVVPKS